MRDLLTRPALELAALVRAGEVTSRELVEASLAQIEDADDQVGAFTVLDGDRALAAAGEVGSGDPRPFAGVPLAIKDLFTAVAGLRMSNGSSIGDLTPAHDTAVTRRLRGA